MTERKLYHVNDGARHITAADGEIEASIRVAEAAGYGDFARYVKDHGLPEVRQFPNNAPLELYKGEDEFCTQGITKTAGEWVKEFPDLLVSTEY